MNEATPRHPQRGDERLMLTCLFMERLCADRAPVSARLEAALGPANTRSLVLALARRPRGRRGSDCVASDEHIVVAA